MNLFKSLLVRLANLETVTHQVRVVQGDIPDVVLDNLGLLPFGSGNDGDGYDYHAQYGRVGLGWNQPTVLLDLIAFDERYRTSVEQIDPSGTVFLDFQSGYVPLYEVDGGFQQDGVHGAHGTRTDRASHNENIVIYDRDGNFAGSYFQFDLNPTAAEDWLTVFARADGSGFFAIRNGEVIEFEAGRGNGDKPGETMVTSVNQFFEDVYSRIDNDGNSFNGHQDWDGVHGQFGVRIVHEDQQIAAVFEVGPMADPVSSALL